MGARIVKCFGAQENRPSLPPHRTTPARTPTSVIRVLAADSSAPPSRPPRRSGTRPLEHVGEEGLGPLLLWIADDIARGPRLDDHPAVHEDQRVANLPGETHLVGDHHHGQIGTGSATLG